MDSLWILGATRRRRRPSGTTRNQEPTRGDRARELAALATGRLMPPPRQYCPIRPRFIPGALTVFAAEVGAAAAEIAWW